MPKLLELVQKRCQFIARNQQYHAKDKEAPLDGAYLIYDTEENILIISLRMIIMQRERE